MKKCLFFLPILVVISLLATVFASALFTSIAFSQTVDVGAGSYSTSLPPGAAGPQNSNGQPAIPKISSDFDQPIQTNNFWSSLIYPFFNDQYSAPLFAHPFTLKAVANGLQVGYTPDYQLAAQDYLYALSHQLTVGVEGMNVSQTTTESYTDWTATAKWEDNIRLMTATLGHGLPFVYFKIEGGEAVVNTTSTPDIWYQQNEVLGITVDGRHYGIFAPAGANWDTDNSIRSGLNNETFLSVALLPDNSPATLSYFRERAYAFVINSTVEWEYNESASNLFTTYSYETVLMDSSDGNINETLTGLYRHQWLYANEPLTSYSYNSPRGEMKLFEGNKFSTDISFNGILPALPDEGDYNINTLLSYVQDVAGESLNAGPSYQNGKAMARVANVIHIADQIGADQEKEVLINKLKLRLEEWFTAGGEQEYSYNTEWDVLTAYPSGFGADTQINDHHFHSSYAIVSAATIARFDPDWASQENWGAMVNLLIRDSNSWNREDDMFPFLRSHDIYAGHSWASGHGAFGDGNNQESSSESMNFASAVVLWGEVTGQAEIRDLGIFLYTTESTAIDQYWFDVDNEVFPESYPYGALGIVWGGKGAHTTWFGNNPEFIHGINLLPVTAASLYLGKHPDYILQNYNEVVQERNGQPEIWKDIFWQYLAMADPDLALSYYLSDPNYEPFDGESRAHTMHWLYNFKKFGPLDTTVTADIPTYAVFKNETGAKTYAAYNASSTAREVTFSDGYKMTVDPREILSEYTGENDEPSPVILLTADKTSGKAPLTVHFDGSNSFDRNGESIEYSWEFDDLGTSSKSSPSFTFTEPGEYLVTLTITNTSGFSDRDSIWIEALESGTPFNENPHRVPGVIQAEEFDLGGEGVAYHDTEEENIGQVFRPNEGVDIENSAGGGYDVYWIVDGEWIEYTFEAEQAGIYIFSPSVASVPGFGYFNMLINGEDVSGRRDVNGTGGWQNWVSINVDEIELEEGVHRLRFEFGSDSDKIGWLFSLDKIDTELSSATHVGPNPDIPQTASLEQNYPNPFNPETSIQYSLPKSDFVKLQVYDISGRIVSTLVNHYKNAGTHSVTFSPANLSSGVYLYRIKAGQFTETKPMVLVK